jgi:GT2 family glycosyltransferase
MDFSVIIPARNAGRTIGECVLATLSQSVPRNLYEVIVVDDGSEDQTAVIARRCGVRVISQPPLSLAAARNTGARAARGDILVFVDADCVPKLDWLAQMVAPFADRQVAGVKGAYLTNQEGLLPRLIQAEWEDTYRRLQETETIDLVDGYSAAYRRDLFLDAGGFDASFALAADVELSCRLTKAGRKLVFAPKAAVYHYHGNSLGGYFEQAIRHGLWRSLLFARHPEALQSSGDARPELQAQIPLVGLTVGTLLLGTRWPRLLGLSGLLTLAFASTTVPAAMRARQSGDDVALAAPLLQFLRALGLGFGMTVGSVTLLVQRLVNTLTGPRRSRL